MPKFFGNIYNNAYATRRLSGGNATVGNAVSNLRYAP